MGRVLGVLHPRYLVKGVKRCLSLQGLIELFNFLLRNSSYVFRRVIVGSGGIIGILSSSFMGFPPSLIIMFDGVQLFVEPLILHYIIVVILEVNFALHSLVQSISDHLSYDLFGHNFSVLVPVSLKGRLAARSGRMELFLVLKKGSHPLGIINHRIIVRILDVSL